MRRSILYKSHWPFHGRAAPGLLLTCLFFIASSIAMVGFRFEISIT
jgi:hypothetical protein